MDDDVNREIWKARIPVAFKLAEDEAAYHSTGSGSSNQPICYMMLSRSAYFGFAIEHLASVFNIDLLASEDTRTSIRESTLQQSKSSVKTLWFEFNGCPLKWHVPIGVLYDCLVGESDCIGKPWEVTVHTKNYPSKVLLPFSNLDDLRQFFLSRVKEACFIKQGSQKVDALSDVQNLRRMWSGLLYDNYHDFEDVNRHLMTTSNNNWFKQFPFCLHISRFQTETQRWEIEQTVREPYNIVDEEGMPWLLGDLLSTMFGSSYCFINPSCIPNEAYSVNDNKDADGKKSSEQSEHESANPSNSNDNHANTNSDDSSVSDSLPNDSSGDTPRIRNTTDDGHAVALVQGIQAPLDTPLQWLAAHLAHPDNFCHIIVRLL